MVDIKGLHCVINYGSPTDTESYIQKQEEMARSLKLFLCSMAGSDLVGSKRQSRVIRWLCSRLQIELFTVSTLVKLLTINCNMTREFLFQFVGFIHSVNNIKKNYNRLVFTVHTFSTIILKFLGSTLFKPDNSLRWTAEASPDGVHLRVDCIPL